MDLISAPDRVSRDLQDPAERTSACCFYEWWFKPSIEDPAFPQKLLLYWVSNFLTKILKLIPL